MPELLLTLLRLGFLALLWLFVLSAVRVVRTDLFGGQPPRARMPVAARPAAARPGPARPPSRRSQARRLVVTEGALAGTTLPLADAPISIGRADDSTLVLTDDYVSHRHARLTPGEGRWLVEDLGSTNGTYLDRDKVTGPTPVPLGTPVRIGKTTLELRR